MTNNTPYRMLILDLGPKEKIHLTEYFLWGNDNDASIVSDGDILLNGTYIPGNSRFGWNTSEHDAICNLSGSICRLKLQVGSYKQNHASTEQVMNALEKTWDKWKPVMDRLARSGD